VLGQTIGIDYYSQVVVVSIFMIGLGLGALLGAWVSRKSTRPALFFACAEIAIAAFAIASPDLLRSMQRAALFVAGFVANQPLLSDFLVYLGVLILPVMLMGASLPIVVGLMKAGEEGVGGLVGRVYAINVLGAVFGTLISGIVLVGTLGLRKTVYVAAITNLVIAAAVAYRFWNVASPAPRPYTKLATLPRNDTLWLIVAFVIGFVSIGYEIFFIRSSIYYFGATSYVFPVVLACFLVWLFVGTRVSGELLRRGRDAKEVLVASVFGALVSTLIPVLVPYYLHRICGDYFVVFTWLRETARVPDFLQMGGVVLVAMVPVGFLSMAFPPIVQICTPKADTEVGASTGRIYFVQTMGNFIGSIVTGGILVVQLGTLGTLRLFEFSLAIVGIGITTSLKKARLVYGGVAVAFVSGAAVWAASGASYYRNFERFTDRPLTRIVEQREGTVLIYQRYPNPNAAYMYIGAEPVTAYNYPEGEGVTCLWPINVGLAALGRPPSRILIIGIGNASSVIGLHKAYPNAAIDVVELLEVVISEMRERGSDDTKDLLKAASVHVMDGSRYVYENLDALRGAYDFIQIGVLYATASGSGNLFTHEFLENLRALLTPDGVLTLNAYPGSVKAGLSLFPGVVISSYGESKVADVFLSRSEIAPDFINKFRKLNAQIASTRPAKPCIPGGVFLITDRSKITAALAPITTQTNDQVASENFLFRDNAVYTESESYRAQSCFDVSRYRTRSTDVRKWPKELADCDFNCLTAQNTSP
jgi:predicted membrane-bound spermidine synthase